MNWYFHSIAPKPQSIYELVKDYSDLLAEGLQQFIDGYLPTLEVQPEGMLAEYPSTEEVGLPLIAVDKDGENVVRYRFKFSAGFYYKGEYVRIGPVPYNITIERAESGTYAHEIGAQMPTPKIHARVINTSEDVWF